MNIKKIFILTALFFAFLVNAENYVFDVNKLVNPRVANGTWVDDEGGYLNNDELNQLNNIISDIEKITSVEIAVVIVPNTGGDIFWAAQNIFDSWGIGKKGKDNGLLLLASIDERQFRTHVGYGLESIFTDSTCRMLQDRFVIPYFKEGKYGTGLIEYVKIIKNVLGDNTYIDKMNKEEADRQQAEYNEMMKMKSFNNFLIFIILSFFFYIIITFPFIYNFKKIIKNLKEHYHKYSQIKDLHSNGIGELSVIVLIISIVICSIFMLIVAFGKKYSDYHFIARIFLLIPSAGIISLVILGVIANIKKNRIIYKWRNDERKCPECGNPMRKLNEEEDDEYLNKFERVEEQIKSNDYDVWICTKCNNKTIEVFRGIKYNLYISCKKCNSVAAKFLRSKVIEHPTYSSTGQKKLDYQCLACDHVFSTYVIIPMLTRSSGSSYSGSSFGSSSSSSFGSSSSSFGGGSSGGGGATSSW